MSANNQLTRYLENCKTRLQKLSLYQGLARLGILLLCVCLFSAWLVSSSGFASAQVWLGRLFIVAAIAIGIYFFILRPKQENHTNYVKKIETRSPEFGGRVSTWLENSKTNNPVHQLLAADTMKIAEQHTPAAMIPERELNKSLGLALLSSLLLVLAILFAPASMNHSLRHLLAGWAVKDGLLPPQMLSVSPGDTTIRLGSNLQINANASGFNPDEVVIHIKMSDQPWQQLSMSKAANSTDSSRYDFSLFAVRETIEYYATAAGVRSPNYQVSVVDLPNVTGLSLTYNYPEWTGLESTSINGGDIDTLPGTNIALELTTDSPLPAATLVLNDNEQAMKIDGLKGTTDFDVNEQGQYYLAAMMGNEQVRLTDDFFITLSDDGKPEIEFSLPGNDFRATNIEEVATELSIKDDYGVSSVELHYAVNGGEWQIVPLQDDSAEEKRQTTLEHLFSLESIAPVDDGNPEQSSLLQAGDLISYFAVAKDRKQTTQTDIFFIEVQPFDRRFSQSQQAGGGGGGGQGENEQEISQKQREIIISTWNLTRERNEQNNEDDARVNDNALLLSSLQNSLAEQASSLIETARSRMLDQDERVKTFIEHMEAAVESMRPASERLAKVELEQALQPEQTALQHLLRADAVYNDIQVGTQQGGQGGAGGGQAAAELTEMFELEIDLKQNQYETGSRASSEQQAEQSEQSLDELADLARRQQQLARNSQNQNELTEAQRWQQELLRRETEELRERLEQQRLERGQQNQQQAQQDQSGDSSSQATSTGGDSQSESKNQQIEQRLDSAIDAMDRAAEAMRNGDQQQLEQATAEAQRQLANAGDQIAEQQSESTLESYADMANQAERLARDQQRLDNTLQDGIQRALANAAEDAEEIDNPFSWEEELAMAEQKRDMNARLQRLQAEMKRNAQEVKSDNPSVARKLEQARDDLIEAEISERLDTAAAYMSQGASLYVANSESMVTRELDKLSEELNNAEEMLAGGGNENSELDQLLAEMSTARDSMQDLLEREETTNDSEAQAANQQQATQGEGEAQGEGTAENQQANGNGGQGGDRWNGWNQGGLREIGETESQLLDEQLSRAALNAGRLLPELQNRGVADENIEQINQLIQELQNNTLSGKQTLVDYNDALATLQLLQKNIETGLSGEETIVRSANPDVIPSDYQDEVAEYYRLLSKDNSPQSNQLPEQD